MATSFRLLTAPLDHATDPGRARKVAARLAWLALASVLVTGLPLFVRMPLYFDVIHYDLCARKLLRGGVIYRDAFDNNLPGVIWLHAAIRAMVGWRSEAIRLVDVFSTALVVLMLLRWVPSESRWGPSRVWAATAAAGFYLFTPEFGHCQRDGWMLLPSVAAVRLRDRRLGDNTASDSGAATFRGAALEGVCWGAAFWIKPFVAIPAAVCWLLDALFLRPERRRALCDAGGLLTGGLLVGGAGFAWLVVSGAWPPFREIVFGWNREYAAVTYGQFSRQNRLMAWAILYLPWSLVHAPAMVSASAAIVRAGRRPGHADPASASRALLAAFYFGWLAQAALVQRPHDYVMVTTVFPAIVLAAGAITTEWVLPAGFAFLLICIHLALLLMPGIRSERLAAWPRCWTEGSTPALRDRLALNARSPSTPDWQSLARVADFLRGEGVASGELTCWSGCTHPLYLDLNLEPSTRFHQIGATPIHFPSRGGQVRAELAASRSRYVVSDLAADLMTHARAVEDTPDGSPGLPPGFPPEHLGTYPWSEPLVFRSGRYVVHRVRDAVAHFPKGTRPPTPRQSQAPGPSANPIAAGGGAGSMGPPADRGLPDRAPPLPPRQRLPVDQQAHGDEGQP